MDSREKKFVKKDYFYGLGRRKAAVSRVRLIPGGSGKITVNERPLENYIGHPFLREKLLEPLTTLEQKDNYDISIMVGGGGFTSQIEASRLGIARALLEADGEFRKALKPKGLLTTDARVKERKKPGLKKARKAPQYTKR
jgi:small subunit ribosomal protein S9